MARTTLAHPDAWEGSVYFCHAPHARNLSHRHPDLEFNLVLAGHGAYVLDDRRYDLHRGSLVWLFPGQEHALLSDTADYRMWVVTFRPALVRRICTEEATTVLRRRRPGAHFCRRLGEARTDRLDALIGDLHAAREDPPRLNAGLAYLLLDGWARFREAPPIEHTLALHPAVERAARLLAREDAPETLPALAKAVGLSPSRLSRLFKEQMDQPLTEYRNRRRLERALHRMETGRPATLLAIALDAGFGSYPQFHRVFTKAFGYPPGEHEKRR